MERGQDITARGAQGKGPSYSIEIGLRKRLEAKGDGRAIQITVRTGMSQQLKGKGR